MRGGHRSYRSAVIGKVMERNELLKHGIAVHRVGDVYEKDQDGMPILAGEKGKWFV